MIEKRGVMSRLRGYSLGWLLVGTLLSALVTSCELRGEDAEVHGAEYTNTESAELTQADSLAIPRATVTPGSRIDRAQLVQLLGDRLPAAVGESCPVLGAVCAPRSFAPTTSCGGFSDTCDSSGTQNGVFIDFICQNGNGGAVCTAVADQTTVTVGCSRSTNGASCGARQCDAPFCLAYPSRCAEQTTQVQNCVSAGVCSNDVCTGQIVTQQAVGTCQRNTDGIRNCPGGCGPNDIGECSDGQCICTCRRC